MKLPKKNLNKEKIIPFILSIIIHTIFILILVIINIEKFSAQRPSYSVLNFIEIKPKKSEIKSEIDKENIIHTIPNKEIVKVYKPKREEIEKTKVDTALKKQEIQVPGMVALDTSYNRLKFAASLLDTFLVLHPEYSRYILQQQAKALVENKNIKKFSRLALEEKINEEMDKYLKENYPEGSEYAPNPNVGPGMQIPIDGLIDAIKKIFE